MNTDFFPNFLQDLIKQVKEDSLPLEKMQAIEQLFGNLISWIGKLAILEYIQYCPKNRQAFYSLFSLSMPQDPWSWLKLFRKILETPTFVSHILNPLMKYPSIKSENAQDRISRLCSFYEMASCGSYLISSSDLLEANEQIWDFIVDLEFLQNISYKLVGKKSYMLLKGRTLALDPFFDLDEQSELLLKEKKDANLEKLYEIYLSEEWQSYKAKQGDLFFDEIKALYRRKYIFIPWIESLLSQTIQNIFQWETGFPFGNLYFVEGYPGSGKSALASQLENFLSHGIMDYCSGFYLEKNFVIKADEILSFFQKKLEKIPVLPKRILLFIDGLDLLEEKEYYRLIKKIKEPPFNTMLFFFFIRCHVYPIDNSRKIFLSCEENPFFEENFTQEYIQSIAEKYLDSPLSASIFRFMAKKPTDFFTAIEIANFFHVFTPVALKELQKMKPLLQCDSLCHGQERYRIFHPICQKI
ncbi:MAG: hypothetical protein HUU50_11200 [Candidatus Brocadiae bacterium]|nr:hypothetical protein [Candidatus Brocadiia bacterium]